MTDTNETPPAAVKPGSGRRTASPVKTEAKSFHGKPSTIPAGGPRAALARLLNLKNPSDDQLFEDAAREIESLRSKAQ